MSSRGVGIDLSLPLTVEQKAALLARLEARTVKSGACWLFQGRGRGGDKDGHQAISVHDWPEFVHRISYAIHHGPIPAERVVRHSCDVPPCWQPDHLKLGTQLDNIGDMLAHGRAVDPPRITGERHHMVTLSDVQIAEIRAKWAAHPRDQRALAVAYGVRQSTIWRLIHRVTRAEASV